VIAAGCYGYYPLAGNTPRPGTEVRVQLTDSGSVALRDYLGEGVTAAVGSYRDRTAAGIQLSVKWTETSAGAQREWAGETVTIPSVLVATTRQRRLSPMRTTLLSVALVAAAVGVQQGLAGAGGGRSGTRPPPGPK
jgi:hypothetical protein